MVSAIYGQTFWKMEKKILKIFEKIAKLSKNNQRWRHSSSLLTNGKLSIFGMHKTPAQKRFGNDYILLTNSLLISTFFVLKTYHMA